MMVMRVPRQLPVLAALLLVFLSLLVRRRNRRRGRLLVCLRRWLLLVLAALLLRRVLVRERAPQPRDSLAHRTHQLRPTGRPVLHQRRVEASKCARSQQRRLLRSRGDLLLRPDRRGRAGQEKLFDGVHRASLRLLLDVDPPDCAVCLFDCYLNIRILWATEELLNFAVGQVGESKSVDGLQLLPRIRKPQVADLLVLSRGGSVFSLLRHWHEQLSPQGHVEGALHVILDVLPSRHLEDDNAAWRSNDQRLCTLQSVGYGRGDLVPSILDGEKNISRENLVALVRCTSRNDGLNFNHPSPMPAESTLQVTRAAAQDDAYTARRTVVVLYLLMCLPVHRCGVAHTKVVLLQLELSRLQALVVPPMDLRGRVAPHNGHLRACISVDMKLLNLLFSSMLQEIALF
mmetsp:Transcript_28326/g.64171  ORF Transcript_28326/g.64171 Transcript_28326/m.64171 type:complete len:402 (-) Transcript_28326:966-2171(-)